MFCDQCGIEIEDGAHFCGSCGAPVSQSEVLETNEVENLDVDQFEDEFMSSHSWQSNREPREQVNCLNGLVDLIVGSASVSDSEKCEALARYMVQSSYFFKKEKVDQRHIKIVPTYLNPILDKSDELLDDGDNEGDDTTDFYTKAVNYVNAYFKKLCYQMYGLEEKLVDYRSLGFDCRRLVTVNERISVCLDDVQSGHLL